MSDLPPDWKEGPPVTVGGVAYPTVLDPYGTQRFVADPILRACVDAGMSLTTLAIAYQTGMSRLTQRQYAELHMKLGYSIRDFCELSSFEDMAIENPLWQEEDAP